MARINAEVAKTQGAAGGRKIGDFGRPCPDSRISDSNLRGFQTQIFADFRPDFGILPGQELIGASRVLLVSGTAGENIHLDLKLGISFGSLLPDFGILPGQELIGASRVLLVSGTAGENIHLDLKLGISFGSLL
ncbi:hypothetical protein CVT26_006136 [Gymnopilus dilepis]|uniref:Uncharacterized protein n=1 Tax=Gymnopilus dilepis TaxID=231916 RepID=A0A409YKP2_9AGAR|nr:hypothetical protein CVT26_006136 [Gymnopilus dilepis]